MIIVHPEQYDEPVDRHIALIIQEWALAQKSSTPHIATDRFNWFTLNGHSAPSIPLINIKQHERVRLHMGSLSLTSYSLHLHGYTWKLVGTEGGLIPSTAQLKGAVLQVPPCTTRTIEFDAWNPGLWPFYSLARHESYEHVTETPLSVIPHGGIFTCINVEKKDSAALWTHPSEQQNKVVS